MLDSPVKRDSGKNFDENVVYIFTKLPDNFNELNRFLGSTLAQTKVQHNQIYDEVIIFCSLPSILTIQGLHQRLNLVTIVSTFITAAQLQQ